MGGFSDGVVRFSAKTSAEMEVVARKVVFELFRRVVLKTPVDTGRARGNWQVGTAVGNGTTEELDKGGGKTIGKVAAFASTFPIGSVAWIYNNLPYIHTLEYGGYPNPPKRGSYVKGKGFVVKSEGGFSRQAPQGMVRVTAMEFEGIVSKAAR